jgi:hypothetical protein
MTGHQTCSDATGSDQVHAWEQTNVDAVLMLPHSLSRRVVVSPC